MTLRPLSEEQTWEISTILSPTFKTEAMALISQLRESLKFAGELETVGILAESAEWNLAQIADRTNWKDDAQKVHDVCRIAGICEDLGKAKRDEISHKKRKNIN